MDVEPEATERRARRRAFKDKADEVRIEALEIVEFLDNSVSHAVFEVRIHKLFAENVCSDKQLVLLVELRVGDCTARVDQAVVQPMLIDLEENRIVFWQWYGALTCFFSFATQRESDEFRARLHDALVNGEFLLWSGADKEHDHLVVQPVRTSLVMLSQSWVVDTYL